MGYLKPVKTWRMYEVCCMNHISPAWALGQPVWRPEIQPQKQWHTILLYLRDKNQVLRSQIDLKLSKYQVLATWKHIRKNMVCGCLWYSYLPSNIETLKVLNRDQRATHETTKACLLFPNHATTVNSLNLLSCSLQSWISLCKAPSWPYQLLFQVAP